ncbi:MAG: CBS domain-containing protein [Haloarculaceae archaeon]
MENIFVARIMSTDVYTVSPDTLVEDAAQAMLDEGIGSVLVVDDDEKLEGILTTSDFVRIVAKSHPKAETAVSRYMTEEVITTSAQAQITDAAATMATYDVTHLPVVDDEDGLIGMITATDLANYLSSAELTSPA